MYRRAGCAVRTVRKGRVRGTYGTYGTRTDSSGPYGGMPCLIWQDTHGFMWGSLKLLGRRFPLDDPVAWIGRACSSMSK